MSPVANIPGLLLDRAHPINRGLMGWWPMNEGGGIRVGDISGNQFHTTGTTTLPKWSGGPFGTAMAFDYALTTYLTFPDMRSRLGTEATFSVWVKRKNSPPSSPDEGAWSFAGTGNNCHYPYIDGTIYIGTFATVRKTIGASAVDLTKWHLVTITSKPGAGGWVMYQNAQPVYSTAGDATVSIPAAPTLGKSLGAFYLSGGYSHLRLYNRALSAVEVAQLYAEPMAGAIDRDIRRFYKIASPSTSGRTRGKLPVANIPGLLLDRAHPLSRGLVGWWPMQEGAGERVNDITGNLYQSALMRNVSPSTTSGWTATKIGRGINFDATDDMLAVPHNASSKAIATLITFNWTISMWVKVDNLAVYSWALGKLNASNLPSPIQTYWEPSGGGYWQTLVGNGVSYGGPPTATGAIKAGAFHNLVVVREGMQSWCYLDGKRSGTVQSCGATTTDGGMEMSFGARVTTRIGQGGITNYRIYDRTLPAAEVAQLYADPMAGVIRQLRFYTFSGWYGVLAKTLSSASILSASGVLVKGASLKTLTDASLIGEGEEGAISRFSAYSLSKVNSARGFGTPAKGPRKPAGRSIKRK